MEVAKQLGSYTCQHSRAWKAVSKDGKQSLFGAQVVVYKKPNISFREKELRIKLQKEKDETIQRRMQRQLETLRSQKRVNDASAKTVLYPTDLYNCKWCKDTEPLIDCVRQIQCNVCKGNFPKCYLKKHYEIVTDCGLSACIMSMSI